MKIVGIGGTNGSGKDTIGNILEEKYGWKFISLTDVLREIAISRGLTTDRENLRMISAELREKYSTGIMIDLVIDAYKKLGEDFKGLVTASLRNAGEADRVHELGGTVIWVDADPKLRHDRISSRQRADDQVSFEEFMKQEEIEMHGATNKYELKSADVKEKADTEINNNSNYEDFIAQIEDFIQTV